MNRNPAFYSNGTPYIDQAATFTLSGDEERTGQDMTLPIGKLHKLTGRVAAEANDHLVNAATVELIAAINKKSIASTVVDSAVSLFHFELIPEGDYILRVTNARDVTGNSEPPPPPGSTAPDSPLENERVLEDLRKCRHASHPSRRHDRHHRHRPRKANQPNRRLQLNPFSSARDLKGMTQSKIHLT